MLWFWSLVLHLHFSLSTAEVICSSQVPTWALPPIASCNYAIQRLERINNLCGPLPVIWSGLPGGGAAVRLPLMFVGQGPDYTPPSRLWCNIMIMWQPRPGSQAPPPTLSDFFPFRAVLFAAKSIRDVCMVAWPRSPPMLGRAWILPNQWVDVQFGVVVGSQVSDGVHNISTIADDGMVLVQLADGSNRTVLATAVKEDDFTCGKLIGQGNGLSGSIQET